MHQKKQTLDVEMGVIHSYEESKLFEQYVYIYIIN